MKEANLRSEIDFVQKSVTRDRLVRGFFDQLHYVVEHQEEDKDKTGRGRMRT